MGDREGSRMSAVVGIGGLEVLIRWDGHSAEPDLRVVHVLAWLRCLAEREGIPLELRSAPPQLRDLLRFLGLDDVFVDAPARSALESRRQPEGGKQSGVEEVVQPDQPAL